MKIGASLFLDLMRVAAALVVFISHCVQFWYPEGHVFWGPLAHSSVIVFFVLSGYLIAYASFAKKRTCI